MEELNPEVLCKWIGLELDVSEKGI